MTEVQPQRTQVDAMDPARAQALMATLGLSGTIAAGDPLPPFFHQVYFWDARPPEALGRDGHPRTGDDLIPDLGLPRRMWAGGRLTFHAPLRAGIPAERTSTRLSVARKQGRSGALGFVTLEHRITQGGALCVVDTQDLVYREDAAPDAPRPVPPQAPLDEAAREVLRFDTTQLFRYSALTFNGHRIHYDKAYAREVEGYDGLVVHGPLLAQRLMLMAARDGALKAFSFRGSAALMHHEPAELCRRGGQMWVRGPDGRQVMTAEVAWV
ncbi:FAS1-like dehydratase domain-containing protein [Sagittula salina]|uniref:MaoC family dehydratase N-terminal domain-containing protein n=1 Tax=Sagittula salina TaxID=2820268 RepID=A0A940MQZ3_9RHOB|nr:MaoC family dehydratase N-terminal domain-containing protein [Sagittula salina]MBP0483113.1 MaoC family dehydratase N-terminal domain-containing protein [Sagittula salina]